MGYARFPASGGSIEWAGIDGGDGGEATVGFRYTLNQDTASSRTVTLRINGVARSITLEHTGKPKSYRDVLSFPMVWQQIHIPAALLAGPSNVIRLEAGTAGGLNIDELRVFPADASRADPDQQNFICLNASPLIDTSVEPRRTGYGDQRPICVSNGGETVATFVYPRSDGDPAAESVRTSFVRNSNGFSSVLGRVDGDLYIGRTSAGGVGDAIDLDSDGNADATFSKRCGFVFQLADGAVTHVEADDFVTMTMDGRSVRLAPYTPIQWSDTGFFWNNIALDVAATRFEVSVDFMPESVSIEEIIGFCEKGATKTNRLVAALSFNTEGTIVPLDGQASSSLSYVAGVTHTIRALFDLEKGRYSVWVKPFGGTEHRLIANALVPEGCTKASDLDTFTYWADGSAASEISIEEYPVPVVYDLKINFQVVTSGVPLGYFADTGDVYGLRGNGFSYGWIDGVNTALARERNSTASPDKRYDTFSHLNYNKPPTEEHTWEVSLPNGTYTVRAVCGDPGYKDSYFHVLAEGVSLVQGDAESTGIRWFEGAAQVAVKDGRLTLSNGPGAYRNKICFVEISGGPLQGEDLFPYQYYEDWAASNLTNDVANPDADPDQDGLINFVEYALGTDPATAETSAPQLFSIIDNATKAQLQSRWSTSALSANLRVWGADDLIDWTLLWSLDEDAGFDAPVISSFDPDGSLTFEFPIDPIGGQYFYKFTVNLSQ